MSPKTVIGRNVPAGHRPGGFTSNLSKRKRPRTSSTQEIVEAANRVLERRGFLNEPNRNDSTQRGGFSRR